MSHVQLPAGRPRGLTLARSFVLDLSLLLVAGTLIGSGCTADEEPQPLAQTQQQQQQQQQTFGSPSEAAQALVDALRADDDRSLSRILGPDTDDLVSSGDDVMDRNRRARFLLAYDQKHQLVPANDESTTLVVGPGDWPLPIPVVHDAKSGQWRFDTEAGREEIINRRIGQNELDVIEVCKAIVDAQREYARRDPDGDGIPEYADRFMSDPGTRNGLFWETGPDEAPSPLGPLVADAAEQGYARSSSSPSGEPPPYHGYYFRMLKSQAASAAGGALDYVINGNMIGGFAVVAYPAEYGNSGIMSFLVDHRGNVYQKDLGPETKQSAVTMESFDPRPGWQIVEPDGAARSLPAGHNP